MSQQQNPLDQLKGIHLPEQLEQLSLAPGWWFLIALATIGLILLIKRWYKKRQALVLLKPALAELKELAQLPADIQAAVQVSALIKRVCLIYFPQQKVASLTGHSWVNFLNNQADEIAFTDKITHLLNNTIYRPNQTLDKQLWQDLIKQSEKAINHIIRQAAKESTR